jgi:hypothetical protein
MSIESRLARIEAAAARVPGTDQIARRIYFAGLSDAELEAIERQAEAGVVDDAELERIEALARLPEAVLARLHAQAETWPPAPESMAQVIAEALAHAGGRATP